MHLVVEAETDVDARQDDNAEWTPLHWAAHYGNWDMLPALLHYEVDIDAEEMCDGR